MSKKCECKDCGLKFVAVESMGTISCPRCGSSQLDVNVTIKDVMKMKDSLSSINIITKTVKKYPIISFLYVAIEIIAFSIECIIPGIIGLILVIPLSYFAHKFGDESKDERTHEENRIFD